MSSRPLLHWREVGWSSARSTEAPKEVLAQSKVFLAKVRKLRQDVIFFRTKLLPKVF